MPKTYVVCIDGTWNGPGQTDRDPLEETETIRTSTNVARTWEEVTGIPLTSSSSMSTISPLRKQGEGEAIYLKGVGSDGTKIERQLAGATGAGISKRIQIAYRFVAERWTPGDHIFGFGFSRGAYAVRSLAGLIEYVGLPGATSSMTENDSHRLYDTYSQRRDSSFLENRRACHIAFLGLWDTVGALAFEETFNNFHQINPGNVHKVCHALALDEERSMFCPEFFEPKANTESVEEVWFGGAHTNVGGGYVDSNLSNIALFWILNKACGAGLNLNLRGMPEWYKEDNQGKPRPSYCEFWGDIPVIGEIVQGIQLFKSPRKIRAGQKIHESMHELMRYRLKGHKSSYVPKAYGANELLLENAIEPWGLE